MLCPRMALPTRIEFCPHARENGIQAILIVLIEAVAVVVDELRNAHGALMPKIVKIKRCCLHCSRSTTMAPALKYGVSD